MTDKNLNKRNPWSRRWERPISSYENSGSLVGSSGINNTLSGVKYFIPSGKDYKFDRLDMKFSTSETKVVSLSIINDQNPWIHHASESNCLRISLIDEESNYVITKYDPLKLEITAATGYCWYKLYVEEI